MCLEELGARYLTGWKVLMLPSARTAEHMFIKEHYMNTAE